jgi:hypothetical protein
LILVIVVDEDTGGVVGEPASGLLISWSDGPEVGEGEFFDAD